ARGWVAHVLGVAGRVGPKICLVPRVAGEEVSSVLRFSGLLRDGSRPSYLPFFPWPPEDLSGFALAHDVIFVGGGNTANMLAIWRAPGFHQILWDAWEAGTVLSGGGAGVVWLL